MASIFVCLFFRSLKHGRWLSLQDIKNPNDTKFMMLNKWNNKFMWNILKEAYGHGLLHLIIRISGTLQGNEYSDSPLLRRNTRALGESPHARRVTHEARRIILGILRGGARALLKNKPVVSRIEEEAMLLSVFCYCICAFLCRGTQREYSSKPLKHSVVERILVFKR